MNPPVNAPAWGTDSSTAHLFFGVRSACGKRWSTWHRLLRPRHDCLTCRTCEKASERFAIRSTRIRAHQPCTNCDRPLRAVWHERDDGRMVALCKPCSVTIRNRAQPMGAAVAS